MKAWNYLSGWTSFTLPNNIQKRLYKFVLRRAIGQFLQNELDLENFDIALINGNLELRDLDLNLQFINKLLVDTPFVLEKGSVASISASIPWSKLLSGDISLRIIGLHVSLRPIKNKPKDNSAPSTPIEEQILSSSLHFADDFLRTEIEQEQTEELHKSIQESFHNDSMDVDMEGVQVLTKVIDKMMSRIKIDIVDTLIRINHKSSVPLTPDQSDYHLDISIPRISYFDETPEFQQQQSQQSQHNLMESSILIPPVANETIKIITIASPEIWLRSNTSDVYSLPNQSETMINDDDDDDDSLAQTEFFDTEQGHSSLFQASQMSGSITPKAYSPQKPYEALLFTTMDEKNWIRMKLRPSIDSVSFLSIKQIDFLVTRIRTIITPQQIAFFMDLLDTMSTSPRSAPPQPERRRSSVKKPDIPTDILDDLDSYNNQQDTTSKRSVNAPERKIKVQMTRVELFVVADDDPVTKWTQIGQEKRNHILLSLKQIHLRHQQFPKDTSHLSSTTDLRIANISLDEWIVKPDHVRSLPFSNTRSQTQYNTYNPIIQFDNRIKNDYADTDHFPAYVPLSNQQPEQNDVVRVRIEKKETRDPGQFAEGTFFEEDINVDIPAFKLLVDPRIVDRLDGYIHALNNYNAKKEEESAFGNSFNKNATKEESRPSVFDDLQSFENTQKRKIKVKCAFIRVILFVPDMSQISTREEFNDKFHLSQLSVDIKKLVATWSSSSNSDSDKPKQVKKPNKINIELNYVNVFMHMKQDKYAKCWFTAKTIQGTNKAFNEGTLCPSIEITIQTPSSIIPSNPARSGYFGSGSDIPENLFNFLNRNENFNGDQKLHIPMDEQSESALIFKQRTIETSMFVVNCLLPQADLTLTKQVWDKVQIIQNDLLLWQPQFLLKQPTTPSDMSSSIDFNHFLTNEIASVMSQSHERLISPTDPVQPPKHTLFSIIAVMSSGVWDINTSADHLYRVQFSEFKYFAAMKHLGQNENITTLDIEELEVYDKKTLLLNKTIPKKIHPKCNTAMVSLFSRLTLYPESNKITKVTSVVASNICWKATFNVDFVNEIVDFQKVPEEMVFIDPPTQYIKVFAHVLETSIDYEPVYSPTRAVIVLDGIEVITNILAGQPIIEVKTFLQSIDLLLIDDKQELDFANALQLLEGKTSDAKKYWSTIGFSNTLSVQNIELAVKIKLDEHVAAPQVDVSLVSTDICLDTNADSFQTLLNLITFTTNNGDQTIPFGATPKPKKQPAQKKKTVQKDNMLASIDESAFKVSPQQISPPTMIDAPEMEEFSFVEEFYQKTEKQPPTKPRRNKHRSKPSEDIIRILLPKEEMVEQEEPTRLQVIEDFFGVEKKVNVPRSVVDITKAAVSVRVSNVNIVWKLYNGYEWEYVRSEMATRELKEKQQPSEQQTGFGEDYNTKRKSQSNSDIEIKLDSISVDFDLMPEKHSTAFYFHFMIKDVEVIDNIKSSAWKKFLGYMRSNVEQREVDSCMVDIELISLRPVQDDPQQEFRLKVKLLPIRLYVDQDALSFLQKYFLFDKSFLRSTDAANASIPKQEETDDSDEDDPDSQATGVFFQHVDIYPIKLKVDYKPKVFNLGNFREGQVIELMNIFRLDGSEVSLNQIKLTGINGIDSLLDKLGQEWLPHILNTQKINMVSGVSPVRSIVNLGTGVADLVLLPIQQYRKDGRIIKGIQKGTSSFARATAIEAIKLSSRVATGTQVILEHADGFFSATEAPSISTSTPSHLQQFQDQPFVYTDVNGLEITSNDDDMFGPPKPSSSTSSVPCDSQPKLDKRRTHSTTGSPNDLTEGLHYAYQNISKNLGSAAQTIFTVPTEIEEQDYFYGSSQGSTSSNASQNAKAVIRAVPVAVIKPMIGLTGAFQSILTGLRNSIDPVMRLQSEDKYKKPK